MLRILPKPQRLEEKEGTLFLDYHCRITIKDNCPEEAYFYAKQLSEQFEHSTGVQKNHIRGLCFVLMKLLEAKRQRKQEKRLTV